VQKDINIEILRHLISYTLVQKLLSFCLLSIVLKIKMYKSIILRVSYGCEKLGP